MSSKESCECAHCRSGCERRPGWFTPGEAERAAELLGLSLEEFFRTRLAVDWWVGNEDGEGAFVLAPALAGHPAGREYPSVPHGRCTFYKGGRCEIHAAKPAECREAWCGDADAHAALGADGRTARRYSLFVLPWRGEPQRQIVSLLGREPVQSAVSIFDLFKLLGD